VPKKPWQRVLWAIWMLGCLASTQTNVEILINKHFEPKVDVSMSDLSKCAGDRNTDLIFATANADGTITCNVVHQSYSQPTPGVTPGQDDGPTYTITQAGSNITARAVTVTPVAPEKPNSDHHFIQFPSGQYYDGYEEGH
jgi:hypothetical protein